MTAAFKKLKFFLIFNFIMLKFIDRKALNIFINSGVMEIGKERL